MLGAALLGWGAATVTMRRNEYGPVLLDSKKPIPRYASLKEMEIVRRPPPYYTQQLFCLFYCVVGQIDG